MTLGTTVKVSSTTLVDGAGADSATITIYNPAGTAVVTAQAMTDDGGGAFSYLYQSSAAGVPGNYQAYITATSGGYNAVSVIRFALSP